MWAEFDVEPSVPRSALCDRVVAHLNRLTGSEGRERDDPADNRACWRTWDFTIQGRQVRVDVDVSDDPSFPVGVFVENESATRSFLPSL